MGLSLHLRVAAEGVENAQQLKFLQAYDCAEGQGYYFSKPVDPSECEALLAVAERRWGERVKVNIPHSLIEVSIKMPSPWQRAEPITAYVSRRTKEGVGVEWCEFAPTIIKDLLRSPSIPLPN